MSNSPLKKSRTSFWPTARPDLSSRAEQILQIFRQELIGRRFAPLNPRPMFFQKVKSLWTYITKLELILSKILEQRKTGGSAARLPLSKVRNRLPASLWRGNGGKPYCAKATKDKRRVREGMPAAFVLAFKRLVIYKYN